VRRARGKGKTNWQKGSAATGKKWNMARNAQEGYESTGRKVQSGGQKSGKNIIKGKGRIELDEKTHWEKGPPKLRLDRIQNNKAVVKIAKEGFSRRRGIKREKRRRMKAKDAHKSAETESIRET